MATTVILGGGVIGVSIAYYLADHQPPDTIHIVDPSPQLFSSASGFAGGFVSKDWFAPPVAALGALSFEEHRKLADREGGREKWGYSPSIALSYSRTAGLGKRGEDWLLDGTSRADVAGEGEGEGKGEGEEGSASTRIPSWLRRTKGDHVRSISGPESTAQVIPLQLCQFLLGKCLERGVRLHQPAKVLSIATDVRDELASVCIGCLDSSTETDIPCTRLVIAAGAWSSDVFAQLFRNRGVPPVIASLAGYSLVVKNPHSGEAQGDQPCHAVFTTSTFSPEIFSRPNNEIYIAGLNPPTLPLPPLPTPSPIPAEAITELEAAASALIQTPDKLEVMRRSLCFRPVSSTGMPVLGRVPDANLGMATRTRPGTEGGVFFAAGHGPWGISLCLGTGRVMSEVVQGRGLSAEIGGLGIGEV